MGKTTTLIIFDEEIPLNDFVEKLFKKLISAMLSSLRTPELTGNEKVRIEIIKG
jgi:hypothetical protein